MKLGFKVVPSIIAVISGLLIIYVIPIPQGVSREAWTLLGIFVGTIAAIIGKAMPIGALSLIAILLVTITGVTAKNPTQSIENTLNSLGNPLIWLIGISIMISKALAKTGLGIRISYYFIALLGKRTIGIAYGLAFSELMLAPITPSNTARGGAIIHPIMKFIAHGFGSDPKLKTEKLIGKYLSLVNYHSNPITSAMFLTATAPNPMVAGILFTLSAGGVHLTWGIWALAMLVPGLIALILMPLILYFLYPPQISKTPNAVKLAQEKLASLGSLKRDEIILLITFLIMLLFWADIPARILGDTFILDPTTTAILGLAILLIFNVLTWDEILKEKTAWDTIFWFSALIMMATYLGELGIIEWFADSLKNMILQLHVGWIASMIILVLAYTYSHYFFASTTAHATAMFGAFFMTGIALGAPMIPLGLMLAAATSIMMCITHYATGTSPVIFSSKYVTLFEWWQAGFIMSVVNLLIWFTFGMLWWKILGYY